jgi:hypothetical protein
MLFPAEAENSPSKFHRPLATALPFSAAAEKPATVAHAKIEAAQAARLDQIRQFMNRLSCDIE